MNIQQALTFGVAQLHHLQEPSLEAEVLLHFLLKKERSWLKTHSDAKLSWWQQQKYKGWIQKRAKHIPVAYIVGFQDWGGLRLQVTKDTLIPRDETEVLVYHILSNKRLKVPQIILDIGTGSGALSIALAKEFPKARVLGLDISKKALNVAQMNAKAHTVQAEYKHSNLLSALPKGESYDLIVANLPYIPESMELAPEVQKEPGLALFSGADGLGHIRELKTQLETKDIQFQELWLEFLPNQYKDIEKIFSDQKVTPYKDVGGDIYFACIS